ncbi:replication protein A 32 kDa subunit-like [Halichoeres trimaculatus]|uniref:replication protein A 32 kDa subunit-like n=1 Tax=Halichoeres trimaculatus TaxID=147232 RepID=UPI003D9DC888
MWNQACSQSPAGTNSHKAVISKRAFLQILPCTVSQLLSASEVGSDSFAICNSELNQVSVVGIIRANAPFVTNIQYSVDDMTGPLLCVRQWVTSEANALSTLFSPGTYVKVIGSLRNFCGKRTLLAMDIRSLQDSNEITSHMLEVVRAHMELSGKGFDVNMNISAASSSRGVSGFSSLQYQVFDAIRKFSVHFEGISLDALKRQLEYISMRDLRRSLAFLVYEGHIFTTVDENHFKAIGQ